MITVNCDPAVNQETALGLLEQIKADKMGGWLTLPQNFDMAELAAIKAAAKKINSEAEYLVCIGIGGSYLGHRALIEALRPKSETKILYAGNSLSRRELNHALEKVGDHDFSVNVISKSGTTLEPALAFSAFKEKLIEKYGPEEAKTRIYAITDANSGTLHDEAVANNYARFVVPDNIGGRYSVLSAVGLLPLAVAGINIEELLEGAAFYAGAVLSSGSTSVIAPKDANFAINASAVNFSGQIAKNSINAANLASNPAFKYAFTRFALGKKGYDTEVFASFEPATLYFNEWLKQLFGESEGKNQQGIFPAAAIYSTDLHSLGQFMQDGRRNLFETIINYPTDELNAKIVSAVQTAHTKGGIPVLSIKPSSYNEKGFGELIYFFELSCALSAKLFGVNPFDQPGVEAYKNELRKLMEKK